ncbi:MAG: hypothetical protein IT208_08305 [Chthonomonadales bacterium]|nr:hypothetical protein [Chthonomonadales bacterium]
MTCRLYLLLTILLLTLAPGAPARAAELPWRAVVAGRLTTAERLAIADLRRYLAQVGGAVPRLVGGAVWRRAPCPAVVVGTPASGAPVARQALARLAKRIRGPYAAFRSQGYALANDRVAGVPVVLLAAHTPEGVVNGIYGLLRELGFGLFLGSESTPARLPARLPRSPVARGPAFAVRGVLPWYNFLNSPTTWDPIDHRAFVDQLVRMGANFLGFHSYDSEPFAAYEEGSRMRWGGHLLSSADAVWGTRPTPTSAFAFGTSLLYAYPAFGAATTRLADADAAIRREQAVMREALAYAHARGLRTCLGFEVNGDPTRAADRAVFQARVAHVARAYPTLDYLWIWQPETQGAQGYAAGYSQHILRDSLRPGSALTLYGIARRAIFRRVVERTTGERPFFRDDEAGKQARATEGARLEQFAQLARRALGAGAGAPRVVVSGWGGDERLLSEEYYEGLDRVLPPEVVFSSLDHIAPRPRIDRVYGELPRARQRWPIPWLENDGDQWHPQPWVHTYEALARDALRGGCQGLIAIHWRTRDVAENLGYLLDFAWDPSLTAEGYFRQMASLAYSPEIAGEMAAIHGALDRLGYRWIGGGGQAECGLFDWGPGDNAKATDLAALKRRVRALLPRAGASRARVEWLLGTMDWVLRFQKAQQAAVRARELLATGKAAEALNALDAGDLAAAMRAYAGRLTTRGEHGVLATINGKAVPAWTDLRNRCLAALGRPAEPLPSSAWRPAPRILLPRFVASARAGTDLELRPLCLGGAPGWMHFRALGDRTWTTRPLATVHGWVRRGVVAGAAVREPGIEVAFSYSASPTRPMAWGPTAITAMPADAARTQPARAPARAPTRATLGLSAATDRAFPFVLRWTDVPDALYYTVERDGEAIADTALTFFPDAPTEPAPEHTYTVEAVGPTGPLARETLRCSARAGDPPDAPRVEARPVLGGGVLTWPAASDPRVAGYRVHTAGLAGPADWVPASRAAPHRFGVRAVGGTPELDVVAVDSAGVAGPAVRVALPDPGVLRRVVLDLPLIAPPEGFRAVGDVAFGAGGADLRDGYLEAPDAPGMDLAAGFDLRFAFRADSVEGMPVILSHGAWTSDGWFVQILGGLLIVRTPDGDAQGPRVEPGRWYAVRWQFDGIAHRLEVDGREAQEPRPLRPVPAARPLRIGQYSDVRPEFAFRGAIRGLRIECVLPPASP